MPILKKAARHGYETTCDYPDVLNKRIHIQQRALACLVKALAHILQRELYTICISNLLRKKAKINHLQPHLEDSRHQELRSSPFWPSPVFRSQLVKDGESSSLKKEPLKTLRVLDPIKISPFVVPTIRKEAPTGNAIVGVNSLQAVTNHFPQVVGNQMTEAPEVSRRSPPFFQ